MPNETTAEEQRDAQQKIADGMKPEDRNTQTTDQWPYMPRPLCRVCLGEMPKLRETERGCELICDHCWQRAAIEDMHRETRRLNLE